MAELDKAWFLKELIRLNAFATSASGLAKSIGYKGKKQMYRILDDTAGEGTVNEVWRRLREMYDLSDGELCEYVNVIGMAKDLWTKVQNRASDKGLDVREQADQTLDALLLRNERGMRRVIDLTEWEYLLDYSRECPMQYAQLIVTYYVLSNTIGSAYKGKVAAEGTALLEGLYRRMQALQPENRTLTEMADAYRSELRQLTEAGNLWTNMLRPTLLVQSFTDPDYHINALSALRLLPVPAVSLWMEHDTLRRSTGTAYILFEVEPDGATGGRYDCIEVEATLGDTKLVARRCFAFWMTQPEADETCSQAFLQFRDEDGQKQIVRYVYDYDPDRQNLHLELLDAENPNCVTFPFPTDLHWVDDGHLTLDEERPWIGWYKDYLATNEEDLYLAMMKSEGVVIVPDYEIVDVAVSRRWLTVSISNGEEETDFRTALKDHPGLQLVEPRMDVAVCRHEDDQELYLEWLMPHIAIPLADFTKVSQM